MTRNELLGIPGFHIETAKAIATHLRATIVRGSALATDATFIIRNEGRINGFLEAVEAIESISKPVQEKTEQKPIGLYSQPPQNQFPNPNQR